MDKDFWPIIEKTIHSKTVEELSDALKDCLQILESKDVDKRNFIKYLNENLMSVGVAFKFESVFDDDIDKVQNVHIHDHEDAAVIYAHHRLVSVSKITEYKSRIQELIELFDNEFESSKTIGLNKDQVSNVLKYLQLKYRVLDIITCKVELEIFLFNNSHKEFNSLCEVFYNAKQPEIYSNMDILLFALHQDLKNMIHIKCLCMKLDMLCMWH